MVEASSNIKADKASALENRPRFERLRQIELEIQAMVEAGHLNEANPPADYSHMDWATKNASKYMCTFPYPYMNGYLHLGKYQLPTLVLNDAGHAYSMSKAEF